MYFHSTASAAVNLVKGSFRKLLITVNTGFTGTLTISDETGTTGTPVIGVITNPAVGQRFEYWNITTGVTVTPSASGMDITANVDGGTGPE